MFKYALAAATLAATVVADSSSSCPATITSTSQADYPSGVMIRTTVTHEADAETFTTTLPLTTTVTSWVTSGTTTSTAAEATSTLTSCTASTTTGVEYTATEYTGSYSSSSLRQSTSCKPWTTAVYEYPLGTTTWTNTYDVYPTSTVTHFEPSAYGNASQITETVTSSKDHTVTITSAGTTTKTEESYCTTTISDTTGTASSTVTQAAKCAPTNLIGTDGERFARYNPYDGIAYSGEEAPKSYGGDAASKDPSSCCQACQDDEECAGSSWYLSTDRNYNYVPACYLYNMTVGAADTCGLAFSMFPGEKKWMQSGCGYIAENVWDPNSNCLPGQTARECADRGTILG